MMKIKLEMYYVVEKKYSCCYRINGMIGFVIEKMDVSANITNINNLLENNFPDAKTTAFLTSFNFIEDFKYQYYSAHEDIENKNITLYHLMFDFSVNISQSPLSLNT